MNSISTDNSNEKLSISNEQQTTKIQFLQTIQTKNQILANNKRQRFVANQFLQTNQMMSKM